MPNSNTLHEKAEVNRTCKLAIHTNRPLRFSWGPERSSPRYVLGGPRTADEQSKVRPQDPRSLAATARGGIRSTSLFPVRVPLPLTGTLSLIRGPLYATRHRHGSCRLHGGISAIGLDNWPCRENPPPCTDVGVGTRSPGSGCRRSDWSRARSLRPLRDSGRQTLTANARQRSYASLAPPLALTGSRLAHRRQDGGTQLRS